MIKEVLLILMGSGVLAVCKLQAQATTTPMVTLRQPLFNVGVKAGFNSSMFFTDEISINGKELEQTQNNYKVGYFAAVFCRFNIKKHHFIQPEFSCNITQGSVSIPLTLANSELLSDNALIKKKMTTFDIPLLYGYKFVDVHPYGMAFFVGPKVTWIWERHSTTEFSGFHQQEIKERQYPFQYSGVIGLAVNVSNIFFDFRYEIGLHNSIQAMSYNTDTTESPHNEGEIRLRQRKNILSFSVGVIF